MKVLIAEDKTGLAEKLMDFLRKKRYVVYLLLLFLPNYLHSQSVTTLISDGDDAFAIGNFYAASVFYQKAWEKDTQDAGTAWKLAEAFLLDNNYVDAEIYHTKVLIKDAGKNFPLVFFRIASAQKYLGKYMEAKKNFSSYYKSHYKDGDYFMKKAEKEIESCNFALRNSNDSLLVQIENCGPVINSVYSELSPFRASDSTFYFSSSKPRFVKQNGKVVDSILVNHAGIYYADIHDSTWKNISQADSVFNNINYHNANVCISPDKKILLFSRCKTDKNEKECALYSRKFINDKWSKAERLNEKVNLSGTSNTQPSVSLDITGGYQLYFASDRVGGFGGFDIWSCTLLPDGKVTNPINLGKSINTPDDEITPFYQENEKTLYFSSTWHNGFGGFDIFRTERKSLYWSEPLNLGHSVNSSYNDLYFTINRYGNAGYFTSNRPGSMHDSLKGLTCCNDIYYFKIIEKEKSAEKNETIYDTSKTASSSVSLTLPSPVTAQGQNVILKEMQKLLPLSLFFHNDEPDPATLSPTTSKNFMELTQNYKLMKDIYKIEYANGLEGEEKNNAVRDIEDFFFYQVENNEKKLNRFLELLLSLLENGRKVEVTLKGYCSPLNSNEYNTLLAKRRISSLINYFKTWNNSALLTYIETRKDKEKMLIIIEESIGELKTTGIVSDDLNDLRNSVYSPSAAKERKIEVRMAEWGEEGD
ncbi:MAG: hypothetical protein A3H98_09355 [Bacteroidetes bacterium RIFCSPLOWO2_02_FULL_36_8]|nr:MAG: hypothetical protein A3H98_09355 [Bacteroidetes bacterium RIFCSPLOWO2_02_FULL_36_8]OFY69157.1 MAG: hypothetical protein A3G23_06315 [Bacteroidetes bacterium RIFCSPLOWO2_12_FULL_37_12]